MSEHEEAIDVIYIIKNHGIADLRSSLLLCPCGLFGDATAPRLASDGIRQDGKDVF
jgi:hypothetical protein